MKVSELIEQLKSLSSDNQDIEVLFEDDYQMDYCSHINHISRVHSDSDNYPNDYILLSGKS